MKFGKLFLVLFVWMPAVALAATDTSFWLACNGREIIDFTGDGGLEGAEFEYVDYASSVHKEHSDLANALEMSEELKDAAQWYRVQFGFAPEMCQAPAKPDSFEFSCRRGATTLDFQISPSKIHADWISNLMGWPMFFRKSETPTWKYRKSLAAEFVKLDAKPIGKTGPEKYQVDIKFGTAAGNQWTFTKQIGHHCYKPLCERNGRKRPVVLLNSEAIDCSE